MRYSNSYIQSYKACPLQCFLKYEVGLEKVVEEVGEHHLAYGRAMHEGLKHLYLQDTLKSAQDAFLAAYPKQLDPEDKAKTREQGTQVLERYVKFWAEEDKKWRVLSVEEKETFDYVEEGFTVKLDLVMENKAYGGIYGFDHKVVGGRRATLSFDFWNEFEPNSQITKYVSFIQSKHGECSGFYINALGMGFRSRAYKGEPAGFWTRFERQMFNRNQSQLDLEQRDTVYWITRIEDSKRTNLWGYNTSSCKFCHYRPICQAGWSWPEDQELITIQYLKTPKQPAPQVSEKETLSADRSGIPSVET